MDHRNLRGARRGVAKEMWRELPRPQRDVMSFVDEWRRVNYPQHSKRFEADQRRKTRAHQAAA